MKWTCRATAKNNSKVKGIKHLKAKFLHKEADPTSRIIMHTETHGNRENTYLLVVENNAEVTISNFKADWQTSKRTHWKVPWKNPHKRMELHEDISTQCALKDTRKTNSNNMCHKAQMLSPGKLNNYVNLDIKN